MPVSVCQPLSWDSPNSLYAGGQISELAPQVSLMNWEALEAVGEIVGAVAVLATLLYLATQIRNQNQQARDANRQFAVAQFNALRRY